MTTDDKKQKPDGYIAQNPKYSSEVNLFDLRATIELAKCAVLGRTQPWREMEEQGWRIRPVKLLFLDDLEALAKEMLE